MLARSGTRRPLVIALASVALVVPVKGAGASTPRLRQTSGIVRAADSKTICLYAAMGTQLTAAEQSTGLDYQCLETFLTGSSTWAQWTAPWIINPALGYRGWIDGPGHSRTLILTINLVPNAVAKQRGWRALGAAGQFDRYARELSRNLVKAGLGRSVIRLGPEMNGPWEVDWIGTTKVQWHLWAVYFARIVRAMRSVPGAHFLFDWNVNANYEDLPLQGYYPGNGAVDIIGIDAYDEASIKLPPVGSPDRWSTLATEPLGLDQVSQFAQEHGKPLSIPEWGTLSTNGDDGAYVAGIGRFVATHDVAYEAWYDMGDNHIFQLSARQAPKSLAAYRRYFG